jgi:hypothetical protein
VAPAAVFKLLGRQLTSVDLTVDWRIKVQYELAKLLYRTFRDDYDLSRIEPWLAYDPNHEQAQERLEKEPHIYTRQGVTWGRLDNALDSLITRDRESGRQVISYGRFEGLYLTKDSQLRERFRPVILPLLQFHPARRPVFWRMLVVQAHLYAALLKAHALGASSQAASNLLDLIPKLDPRDFDWRTGPGEAPDQQVLVEPFTAARAYLERRLAGASQEKGKGHTVGHIPS